VDYRPRNRQGEQDVQNGCVYALHFKAYLRLARRALSFATPAVERVGSFRRIILNRTVMGGCYSIVFATEMLPSPSKIGESGAP
jgi:hypothetical protein